MEAKFDRRTLLAGLGAILALPARSDAAAGRTVTLSTAAGRDVTFWHWKPTRRPKGQIAFSHGAASAPWKYEGLLGPWVERGWEIFAPLHVDSTDHPDTRAFPGLKSWQARIEDMRLLSRQLLRGGFVASGHSYGALTALTLGGARAEIPDGMTGPLSDPHARCVVAFSPPGPMPGLITQEGYEGLRVPALVQTGTRDIPMGAPEGMDPWRVHLTAYDAPPAGGDRYALVLKDVDHYFRGAICDPRRPGPPQTEELARAALLSGQFIDAFGRRDAKALPLLNAQLTGEGAAMLFRR